MRFGAAGLALVLALGGCAVPHPGPYGSQGAPARSGAYGVSDAEVRREQERLARLAEARMQDYKARVERVGARLLEHIPDAGRIQFVIDFGNPQINAGATFGQVIVTSGILDFLRSDDELAMVLGHEIAHIDEGHVTKGMIGGLALSVLAIVVESQAPGMGNAAGGLGQLALNRYTQGQEREADRVGIEYAYRAGYDPRAAADVQERLAVSVPQTITAGYFDTHPSSVERMVAARRQAEGLLAQGPPPGRAEVLAMERRALERSRDRGVPPADVSPAEASFRPVPEPRPAPEAELSDDCRRAESYVRRAGDETDAEERERLYRRALRYCPGLDAARQALRRERHDARGDGRDDWR